MLLTGLYNEGVGTKYYDGVNGPYFHTSRLSLLEGSTQGNMTTAPSKRLQIEADMNWSFHSSSSHWQHSELKVQPNETKPMLVWCWATACDAVSTLPQHCLVHTMLSHEIVKLYFFPLELKGLMCFAVNCTHHPFSFKKQFKGYFNNLLLFAYDRSQKLKLELLLAAVFVASAVYLYSTCSIFYVIMPRVYVCIWRPAALGVQCLFWQPCQ